MRKESFTEADLRQIEAEGLTPEAVAAQIDRFRQGAAPMVLDRPCTVGDGIDVIPEGETASLVTLCEGEVAKGRAVKFVPASGAASRMFQQWYAALEQGGFADPGEGAVFRNDLKRYAFYVDLRAVAAQRGEDLEAMAAEGRDREILSMILEPAGLNYGLKPKALLRFHGYPDGNRTALEEHLTEAALYACDAGRICRIHVTVSEEHREGVGAFLKGIKGRYEGRFGVTYREDISIQESFTNTIAVDPDNRPFRDREGRLIFRPGGHGALLTNLNGIDGDIIFLKNIDNIVPDHLKDTTVRYKKILGGTLVSLQKRIYGYCRLLAEGRADGEALAEIETFCRQRLHILFPDEFSRWPKELRQADLFGRLNRPIRVCGMVRNEGEPGGGPFWVREADGSQSLQIIEGFQVDRRSPAQQAIWRTATHFNPVDLVCGVRDYRGQKFDLHAFVDPAAVCITRKSEKGRDLKALERPGLWNGSMARWITVFVEVPLETFNPVKTIYDLLRPQHLPSS